MLTLPKINLTVTTDAIATKLGTKTMNNHIRSLCRSAYLDRRPVLMTYTTKVRIMDWVLYLISTDLFLREMDTVCSPLNCALAFT